VNTLNVPGSDFYGHTFTSPTGIIAGSGSPGFGFYDDFLFSIGGAAANALTSTINLSDISAITNLQVRLFDYSLNTLLPVLGTPNGTVVDGWSTPVVYAPGVTGLISILPETILAPGTYVLEVRGTVLGSAGGSYSGVLNLAPVPLPAALPMLLAGLGLLVRVARRHA
jgi:hypothetical protein